MEFRIVAEGKGLFNRTLDSVRQFGIIEDFRIAVAPFLDGASLRDIQRAGFPHTQISFAGEPCYIVCNGLRLHARPRVSNSSGSEAIYLGEWDNGEHSYLLQQMPPNAVTSRHYHGITTERFHNLSGQCFIEVHGTHKVLSGETLQVDPFKIHQVRTGAQPSLNLIEMLGNPNGLSMDDHHYVPEGLEI